MNDLLSEIQDKLCILTINRISKNNAFDNHLLAEMHKQLDTAINNPAVRVIILKANGKHFSAGADLAWMQSMAEFSEAETAGNIQARSGEGRNGCRAVPPASDS